MSIFNSPASLSLLLHVSNLGHGISFYWLCYAFPAPDSREPFVIERWMRRPVGGLLKKGRRSVKMPFEGVATGMTRLVWLLSAVFFSSRQVHFTNMPWILT